MLDNTLIKIKNVGVRAALLSECHEYNNDKFGVVTRSLLRWQPDLECKIHLVDVLVDGTKITYWRPVTTTDDDYEGIDDCGFWERVTSGNDGRSDRRGAAFLIRAVE